MTAMPARHLVRRLLAHLRPFRLQLILVVFIDLLSIPITLLTPLPLAIAVDYAVAGRSLPDWATAFLPAALTAGPLGPLALAVGLMLAIALLGQAQRNGAWLLQSWVGERVVLAFRAELFRQVQRLSLLYHDARGTSDSLYRIQYDATAIQWIAVYGVAPLLTAAGTLVGMFFVLLSMDAKLAVIALSVGPLLVLLTHRFGKRVRLRWHLQKEIESSVTSVLQEVLTGLRVVKAFGQERREEERFLDRAGREVSANLAVVRAQAAFFALTTLVLAAGTAAALWVSVRNVQAGTLTLGGLTLVMAYLAQLYGPLETLMHKFSELQSSFASAERAFALLDETVDVQDRPDARPLAGARGEIELRDVGFAYVASSPVLAGASARFPAGTRVGIVGRTGAGKTTLINLLTRFHDPDSGAVLLDGTDIRDLKLEDLRRQFAIVLQEPVLFSTSIAENIAYGRPEASEAEIEAAARAANAHEFIAAMPDGYRTQVGERGMMLSGGQRQRIALARAFLKDAPILILDEPTSSVDLKTEAAIIEAMERLMAGRTTFIVAHRLATLRHCDVIFAVEDGKLVPASVEASEPLLANRGLSPEAAVARELESTE
jgi:ATP-binding cassette subfamily B protein